MPSKSKVTKRVKRTKPMKKAEIVSIAKKAVKNVAEKKWFNSQQIPNSVPTLPSAATASDRVTGIGYSTTEDTNESGAAVMFCGQQVKEMMCLRPWALNTLGADSERKALAMDGKWLQPVSCKTRFRLSRNHTRLDEVSTNTTATPDYPLNLAQNCPVIARIMRVTPKLSAGTTTEIAPNSDLFINEYGEALGPEENDFDVKEMLFYKINKRRYTVLEDETVKVLSPVTLQYAPVFNSYHNETRYSPIVTNTNAKCERYITMYHQLSKNKGGKCYYEDPLAAVPPTTATTGHRREYVFMLFAYQGADEIVGSSPVQIKGPTEINIEHVNYSKFIDV